MNTAIVLLVLGLVSASSLADLLDDTSSGGTNSNNHHNNR